MKVQRLPFTTCSSMADAKARCPWATEIQTTEDAYLAIQSQSPPQRTAMAKPMPLYEIINHFFNGNHDTAKAAAKRFKTYTLYRALINKAGMSENKAHAVACYLKGNVSWSHVCGIE